MPDTPVKPDAKGKKILGMPRTTGLIVIAGAAVVVGYFVISKFSGSQQQGQGQGKGNKPSQPRSAPFNQQGPGFTRTIIQHQGHQPRQPHHHPKNKGSGNEGQNP